MEGLTAIYWRLYIVRLALRWVSRINVGDQVSYLGLHWTLIQGVSDPVWSLICDDTRVDVHRDEFTKVRSLKNWINSFRSGYRFYMQNWYSIWMREGIEPWMLGCNIWAGKPPAH